ncbi:MAG: hypothetical protein CMM93_00990, partial [Rickettsiales bacterium]|nr:hypothetical protein [Rickettsiales bacterium]
MTTQPEAQTDNDDTIDEVIEDFIEGAEPQETEDAADDSAIAAMTESSDAAGAKPATVKSKGKRWYIIHAYTG